MADSKITQLPLSPYVLDKDLMVVVTGHLEEGAYPQNAKVPLSYIRRYVVRLNLLTSPQSGIGTYYNSGLNILTLQHIPRTGNLMRYDYEEELPHHQTISTTGLNSIPGNLVDIKFNSNSEAATAMAQRDGAWLDGFKLSNLGEPYHSGIISITGLNAYSGYPWGNLIRVDYDNQWPYSGIISQSGLNAIKGNLIDIQFAKNSDAATAMHDREGSWDNSFNKNLNLGEKYHSGIISVTGVNARTENNIIKEYENNWPHTGVYYNSGLNAIAGNLVEIQFNKNTPAPDYLNMNNYLEHKYWSGIISITGLNILDGDNTGYCVENTWPYKYRINTVSRAKYSNNTIYLNNDEEENYFNEQIIDSNLKVSYKGFFFSKAFQTLNLFANTKFRANVSADPPPYIPSAGSTNDRKTYELRNAPSSINYTYRYYTTTTQTVFNNSGSGDNNYSTSCPSEGQTYTFITTAVDSATTFTVKNGVTTLATTTGNNTVTFFKPNGVTSLTVEITNSNGNSWSYTATRQVTVIQSETRTKYPTDSEWENLSYNFIQDSCSFSMNLSGNNVTNLYNTQIVFRNNSSTNTTPSFYSDGYGSLGAASFPINHEAIVRPYLNSHLETTLNTTAPQYNLSNIRYNRNFRIFLDNSPVDGDLYYNYISYNLYSSTNATVYNNRYFSLDNIVSSDDCPTSTGSYIEDPDPDQDNFVTGGSFSNGILTLTRLGLSDIQIEIPASEGDGNNYPTGLFFDNNTRNLTIGLSGLSDLSVNIPDSDANNYITDMLFDNNSRNLTLERLGLSDLIVNIPDTSSTSNIRNYRTISSNKTLTTGDEVVIIDASSNSVDIILPPAANMAGRTISVKISDILDPYSCNIQTQNSETIDGNSTYTIYHKNTSISLFSNSNNWFIL